MIHFDQVSKQYGNRTALNQVHFQINTGEMVFLTGHSGAGKSTIIRLLTGLEKPSRGQIIYRQQNLGRLPTRLLAKHRQSIGIILQDPHLLADHSIYDNIALPLYIQGMSSREIKKRVAAALGKVNLREAAHHLPEALSAGEQQRIGIARAIINKPALILADEATGNLDPKLSHEIFDLFAAFQQVGVTVLVATHDINLVNSLPYRVLTLEQGCITSTV